MAITFTDVAITDLYNRQQFDKLVASMRDRKAIVLNIDVPNRSLATGQHSWISLPVEMIISLIEAESGSGKTWNIKASTKNGPIYLFWSFNEARPRLVK